MPEASRKLHWPRICRIYTLEREEDGRPSFTCPFNHLLNPYNKPNMIPCPGERVVWILLIASLQSHSMSTCRQKNCNLEIVKCRWTTMSYAWNWCTTVCQLYPNFKNAAHINSKLPIFIFFLWVLIFKYKPHRSVLFFGIKNLFQITFKTLF